LATRTASSAFWLRAEMLHSIDGLIYCPGLAPGPPLGCVVIFSLVLLST